MNELDVYFVFFLGILFLDKCVARHTKGIQGAELVLSPYYYIRGGQLQFRTLYNIKSRVLQNVNLPMIENQPLDMIQGRRG